MATVKPDLTRVWASDAPSEVIVDPDVTTEGKVAAGWRNEIPPYEHFNYLQQWFTGGLAHINEQGIAVWDGATTYPLHALAKGSDGKVYKSKSEQQDNDPTLDTLKLFWSVFGEGSNAYTANLKEIYDLTDGADITSALLDAFTKYASVTLGGLQNVTVAPNTDLTTNRVCSELIWDGATVVVEGSQLILGAENDQLGMKLDVGSGQLWGDGKYVQIAEDSGVNTNTLKVFEGSDFVIGDRVTSSFDNTYLANSSGSKTVNTLLSSSSNGDGTETWTLSQNYGRRPDGERTGNVVFQNTGNLITFDSTVFIGAERIEPLQYLIITGSAFNNETVRVGEVDVVGNSVTCTILTDDIIVDETVVCTVDFRGDKPIPAGSYALTADFQKNGLVYYGAGDFTLTADESNPEPIRRWRGYIASCVDKGSSQNSYRGTFTLAGVDWSASFLDGYKVAKLNVNILNTTCIGTLDVGKQGVLLDLNENSITTIKGNRWDRQNEDIDFLWYPVSDTSSLVYAGSYVVENNIFSSTILSLPYAGTDRWGRSRLVFDRGSLHVFSVFYTDGVVGGVFASKNNKVSDYSRAFFSTSRKAVTEFQWGKISSENDEMGCDFSLIFEIGVGATTAARKRYITVTNSSIVGSQESLNIGSLTTYYNCIISTSAASRALIEEDVIGVKTSIIHGGSLIERFRVTGGVNKLFDVRIPYAPSQAGDYGVPLFGNTFINPENNLVLETPDVSLTGNIDLAQWFSVNIDEQFKPAAPKITFQFERVGVYCSHGNTSFSEPYFRGEIPAESSERAPYPITGSMFFEPPLGSTFKGYSDKSTLEIVGVDGGTTSSPIDGSVTPVNSFTVNTTIPYGHTHFSVIRRGDTAQSDVQFFFRLDKSSWGSTTVTIQGGDTLDFDVAFVEPVKYYTTVDRTPDRRGKYYIDPSTAIVNVQPFMAGLDLLTTRASLTRFYLQDNMVDGATIGFIALDAGATCEVNEPSGWNLVSSGGNTFAAARYVMVPESQVLYKED